MPPSPDPLATDSLAEIIGCLTSQPELLEHLTLTNLVQFICYTARLRRDILLTQRARLDDPSEAPSFLPRCIIDCLADVTHIPVHLIPLCWDLFRNLIWNPAYSHELVGDMDMIFRRHGAKRGLTSRSFYPPNECCTRPGCASYPPLKKAEQRAVIAFTMNGAEPAYTVRLYCPHCQTTYQNNYAVHKRLRTYYTGIVPAFIQVGQHQYVQRELIELWIRMLLHGWVSFTNCARIYNSIFRHSAENLAGLSWQFSAKLRCEHVAQAFFTFGLLRDAQKHQNMLIVPHHGLQRNRFTAALQERNSRMQRNGLPHTLHFCWKCTRFEDPREKQNVPPGPVSIEKVSCVVIDGITIGHPCCAVPRCTEPLENQRHRHCPLHRDHDQQCRVVGCERRVAPKSRCCDLKEHQALDAQDKDRPKAIHRLQELYESSTNSIRFTTVDDIETAARTMTAAGLSMAEIARKLPGDWAERDLAVICAPTAETEEHAETMDTSATAASVVPPLAGSGALPNAKSQLRADFARHRTHNEQIMNAPCGVILGRGTFHHHEAISSVAELIKRVFAHGYKPEFVIFDNGCHLLKYLKKRNDPFFVGIAIAVDVFHFKAKHKVTDTFCREYCNPYAHEALRTADGQGWFFNTSIAEQNNVWLAGFSSIVREMTAHRHNFLLDELITYRNEERVAKLARDGFNPSFWSGDSIPGLST